MKIVRVLGWALAFCLTADVAFAAPAEMTYDVVVAGGGPAGIGAGYTAAVRGAKTLVIEKSGRLGGMAVQAMVSPFSLAVDSIPVREIAHRIGALPEVDVSRMDLLAYDLLKEAGADVLLHATVTEPILENGRVTGVEVLCAEGRRRIRARVVIDATGDGFVAERAGVPFELGRKEDGLVQPMSIMFTIAGIERGKRRVCGSEMAARQMKIGGKSWEAIVQEEIAAGKLPPEVGVIRLYRTPRKNANVVNATQVNRLYGTRSADLTTAEIACRRQAFQVLDVLRRRMPGYAGAYVEGMPAVIGVRETRRFEGVDRLETADVLAGRKRADAIVRGCSFVIDIHNPTGGGQAKGHNEYGVNGEAQRVKPYDSPYGAIVPRRVEGLLFAGRILSASHEALASCRVMGNAMAIGIGAGAAAAYAVRHDMKLRDVPAAKLGVFGKDWKNAR